jgi:hypothetical protein
MFLGILGLIVGGVNRFVSNTEDLSYVIKGSKSKIN